MVRLLQDAAWRMTLTHIVNYSMSLPRCSFLPGPGAPKGARERLSMLDWSFVSDVSGREGGRTSGEADGIARHASISVTIISSRWNRPRRSMHIYISLLFQCLLMSTLLSLVTDAAQQSEYAGKDVFCSFDPYSLNSLLTHLVALLLFKMTKSWNFKNGRVTLTSRVFFFFIFFFGLFDCYRPHRGESYDKVKLCA